MKKMRHQYDLMCCVAQKFVNRFLIRNNIKVTKRVAECLGDDLGLSLWDDESSIFSDLTFQHILIDWIKEFNVKGITKEIIQKEFRLYDSFIDYMAYEKAMFSGCFLRKNPKKIVSKHKEKIELNEIGKHAILEWLDEYATDKVKKITERIGGEYLIRRAEKQFSCVDYFYLPKCASKKGESKILYLHPAWTFR